MELYFLPAPIKSQSKTERAKYSKSKSNFNILYLRMSKINKEKLFLSHFPRFNSRESSRIKTSFTEEGDDNDSDTHQF